MINRLLFYKKSEQVKNPLLRLGTDRGGIHTNRFIGNPLAYKNPHISLVIYLFPASWANPTGKHKNMNGQEENYRNRNDFMHSKNNWSFVKNQPKRPRQKRYKNQYKDNAPSCVYLSPVQTGMYQTEQKKQHRC